MAPFDAYDLFDPALIADWYPRSDTERSPCKTIIFAANDPRFTNDNGEVLASVVHEVLMQNVRNGQHFVVMPSASIDRPNAKAAQGFAAATGSQNKINEIEAQLTHHDITVSMAEMAAGTSLKESEERGLNGAIIVQEKLQDSILNAEFWQTPESRQRFAENIGLKNPEELILGANDICTMFDPRLKDTPTIKALFEKIASHNKDCISKQGLIPGNNLPGVRQKEIAGLVGGNLSLANIMIQAMDEAKAMGIEIDTTLSLGMWQYIKPAVPGVLNIPDEGLLIYSQVDGVTYAKDLVKKFTASKDLAVDGEDIQVPPHYREMTTKTGQDITYAMLRDGDPRVPQSLLNEFFRSHYHPGAGLRHALSMAGVLETVERQKRGPITVPTPKVLAFSSASFASSLRRYSKQGHSFTVQKARDTRIDDFTALGRLWEESDAIILNTDPKIDGNRTGVKNRVQHYLKMAVAFTHLALDPFGGSPTNAIPLIVDGNNLATLSSINALYTTGAVPNANIIKENGNDSVHIYKNEALSAAQITQDPIWNATKVKQKPAKINLDKKPVKAEYICEKMGLNDISDLGFTCSAYGSASMKHKESYDEAEEFAYECAVNGITLVHGAGSESLMGAYIAGAKRAYDEGYRNFRQIGHRAKMVSAKEGTQKDLLKKFGLTSPEGSDGEEPDYWSAMDGHLHFFNHDDFYVRQDAIGRFSHVDLTGTGGAGTLSEFAWNLSHNAMVEQGQPGSYTGSEINDHRIKPQIVLNMFMERLGRSHFDSILKLLFGADKSKAKLAEEMKLHKMSVVDTADEAFLALEKIMKAEGIAPRTVWYEGSETPSQDVDPPYTYSNNLIPSIMPA